MNNYLAPWHIFIKFEGMPTSVNQSIYPEIYYS